MRYQGGKSKISKQIASFLESKRKPSQLFVEPFLGGCNILPEMCGPKLGAEIIPDLVLFYNALLNGWIPPDFVSEEEYNFLKREPSSALRGFVGISCSFAGKWFGGYARSKDSRNYAKNGKNSAMKLLEGIKEQTTIVCSSYEKLEFPADSLVYCDPPYLNTTRYKNEFDSESFWNWAKIKSKNNKVFVSEYCAPEGWERVLEIKRNLEMRTNKNHSEARTEKIFCYQESKSTLPIAIFPPGAKLES